MPEGLQINQSQVAACLCLTVIFDYHTPSYLRNNSEQEHRRSDLDVVRAQDYYKHHTSDTTFETLP